MKVSKNTSNDCDNIDIEIEYVEKEKLIDFSDITTATYGLADVPSNGNNIVKCIGYLHDLIERFRNGEATTMTSVTLLKDGRMSVWVPNGFSHNKVDSLFDPIVKELKESETLLEIN